MIISERTARLALSALLHTMPFAKSAAEVADNIGAKRALLNLTDACSELKTAIRDSAA